MKGKGYHIKKNDRVMVIAGKEKGKAGKVLKVLTKRDRVIVEKLNMIKKATRASDIAKGGILEKEGPIHISNVMLICEKCTEATPTAAKVLEDGRKVRTCKKCGEVLD